MALRLLEVALTDKRLEEIRKRVEAATPGPWEVEDYRCDGDWRSTGNVWARNKGHYHPGMKVCGVNCHSMSSISDPRDIGEFEGNSAFIAHAREDIPFLLSELAKLQAENATLRRQVEAAKEMRDLLHLRLRYCPEALWLEENYIKLKDALAALERGGDK